MADQPRSKLIEKNPIGNGLDAFRASFNSTCERSSVSCGPDALEQLTLEGNGSSGHIIVSGRVCLTIV